MIDYYYVQCSLVIVPIYQNFSLHCNLPTLMQNSNDCFLDKKDILLDFSRELSSIPYSLNWKDSIITVAGSALYAHIDDHDDDVQ